MWLALVFMTLSSYIFLCYYNSIRGYFLTRNMNGPPTLPIIGNAHQFLNKTAAGKFKIIFMVQFFSLRQCQKFLHFQKKQFVECQFTSPRKHFWKFFHLMLMITKQQSYRQIKADNIILLRTYYKFVSDVTSFHCLCYMQRVTK